MNCEKEFFPVGQKNFLYCSEGCRLHDQSSSHSTHSRPSSFYGTTPTTPSSTAAYSVSYTRCPDDGPDIVPRASPTTHSRPRSYFASEAYSHAPASYSPATDTTPTLSSLPHLSASTSQTTTPRAPTNNGFPSALHSQSSTALASLRDLANALPKPSSSHQSSSTEWMPDHRTGTASSVSASRSSSAVWSYIPFSSTSAPRSTSPDQFAGDALRGVYPGSRRSREDLAGYGAAMGFGNDRPLPPKRGPSGYAHRPKSIDLITPMLGGS